MHLFWYTQTMNKKPPTLSVNFFCTEAGNEPVREWLTDLSKDDRKAIGTEIKTVQIGWPIGMPVVRKMGDDLWEIRIHLKDGIARVFFTVVGSTMVLLHGFIKKSDKTPATDLEAAKKRKAALKRKK